jgi:hypothetical protein
MEIGNVIVAVVVLAIVGAFVYMKFFRKRGKRSGSGSPGGGGGGPQEQ